MSQRGIEHVVDEPSTLAVFVCVVTRKASPNICQIVDDEITYKTLNYEFSGNYHLLFDGETENARVTK